MYVKAHRCAGGLKKDGILLGSHAIELLTLTSGHFVSPPTTCICYDRISWSLVLDIHKNYAKKSLSLYLVYHFHSKFLTVFISLLDCIMTTLPSYEMIVPYIRSHTSEVESNVLGLQKWMQRSLVCILKLCWHSQAVVDPHSIRPCFVLTHCMC